MNKKICLLHANCQGEPVEGLLKLSPEFDAAYEIRRFTNYIREPVPDSLIADCDLFLYQYLGDKWGALGSESIRSKLKRQARSIAFPSMFFKGYWPLWGDIPGFDYSDIFLESLLEKELSESQILYLYLKTRLGNVYNLNALFDKWEQHEREKEAFSSIKYVDLILSGFREKRMFNTVNHPQTELLLHTADSILGLLDMPALKKKSVAGFPVPFPEFELPIHPQVAEHLGLEFGGPEEKYHVYGAELTFEEYAVRYIKCRRNNITDFISFLYAAAKTR